MLAAAPPLLGLVWAEQGLGQCGQQGQGGCILSGQHVGGAEEVNVQHSIQHTGASGVSATEKNNNKGTRGGYRGNSHKQPGKGWTAQ